MHNEDDLDHAVEKAVGSINAMVHTGNGAAPTTLRVIDPGSENIMRAAELSSDALRAAYEACAERAVELAKANVARALEDQRLAEQFANAVRSHGKHMAEKLEGGFSRASTMASTLADGQALIEQS